MGFFGPNPSKPAPKVTAKPAPAVKPQGLFGGKNEFRTFKNMNEFVRKAPDRAVPGYGEKMYKGERLKEMGRLQQYAEKYLGKKFGFSPKDLGSIKEPYSILGRMAADISKAKREGRWADAKQLQKEIKAYSQWKEGFK